ncbi:Aste57867_16605 [Aphanomyces stellatus]|uniref:Aste57867_16605 protein n=1 Tax=Aphanomyces stellatus TaxID=120398 RepID=A0A485L900_9STRA|nr:hypothetical protein As57867_016548 [Aphanomyces stellatus]VFT93376.1 Aste57867_16605 [Aphanomyces stellatus]
MSITFDTMQASHLVFDNQVVHPDGDGGGIPCAQTNCPRFAKIQGLCLNHTRLIHIYLPATTPAIRHTATHMHRPHCHPAAHHHRLAPHHYLHHPTYTLPEPPPSSAASSTRHLPSPSSSSDKRRRNHNRRCRTDGCGSYARGGGLCTRHGGGRKCKIDGCDTASQTGGYCRQHGGGSKCRERTCSQFARVGGRCLQHRTEGSSSSQDGGDSQDDYVDGNIDDRCHQPVAEDTRDGA